MYLIRPSSKKDLEALVEFSYRSQRGLTSLPRNPGILENKIIISEKSFEKKAEAPGKDYYLFVLEDTDEKKVVGCSAIYSLTGWDEPIYYFRIVDNRFLWPVHYEEAGSKLCSLYLLREYREKGLGKLLSLSRFHFIKDYEHRFSEEIYAEMRGFIQPPNYCPFWEAVGRKIIGMSFEDFENELDKSHEILSSLMVGEPIDLHTLPKEAQEAVGKTHESTKGALKLLEQEGFVFSREISIDDGGPRVVAKTKALTTGKASQKILLSDISSISHEGPLLLSNCRLDFRAILREFKGKITLSEQEKQALEVNGDEAIRISLL
jgi:arginine N-succinyltransferase